MTERELLVALDDAVERVLAGGAIPVSGDPEIGPLVAVAAALRDLPSPGFREALRRRLIAPAEGPSAAEAAALPSAAPEGLHTITPYLVVERAAELIDFVKGVFGAEERLRTTGSAGGIHCEVRVGDSTVMIGGGPALRAEPTPTALHLYVEDADALFGKAVSAGATPLYGPVDQPYGDREAGVVDPFGNRWYIGARRGAPGPPEGLRSVTVSLHPRGADGLIDFLREAFGGETLDRVLSASNTVTHACVRIGDSVVQLAEAHGPFTSMTTMFYLCVRDTDALYRHALAAGGISLAEPADQPYGARVASLRDPSGNVWYLSTPIAR